MRCCGATSCPRPTTTAAQLARVALQHDLVLTHGNGPQVGLLALQAAAYVKVEAYPLDVLGAQTDGMIGYLLEQELANRLPATRTVTTLITRVEVDPQDPAFQHPTKPIGPVYSKTDSERVAANKGWVMAPNGQAFRRVVASPRYAGYWNTAHSSSQRVVEAFQLLAPARVAIRVNMMTAQRAYQANAQTIKTQDQVMSTLVNLR
eukprot:gene34118-42068_t